MQEWEYLQGWLYADQWLDSKGRSGTAVETVHRWYDLTLLLDQLGAEGWELVSVDANGAIFFFKRPKP